MRGGVKIEREDMSAQELRRLAGGVKDGRVSRRLLAMALVLEGLFARLQRRVAEWIDCDLSKHCRHYVGVQNPQCLSQCRMARRLAIPAETQPVEVLARQTATRMKGRFHPFATAEHRKKDEAQYRVQPMEPTLLASRIRDCAQNRTNRNHG